MGNADQRDGGEQGTTGPSSDDLLAEARRKWLGAAATSEDMARAARQQLGLDAPSPGTEGSATEVSPEGMAAMQPGFQTFQTSQAYPASEASRTSQASRSRPAPPEAFEVIRNRSPAPPPTAQAPPPTRSSPPTFGPAPATASVLRSWIGGLVAIGLIIAAIVAVNLDDVPWFSETAPDRSPGEASSNDPPGTTVPASELINLARFKPVTASGEYQVNVAGRAVDGNVDTGWNSGGFPPQWIVVDLGAPMTVYSVQLLVGQSPPGETTHEVVVWGPDREEEVVHVFSEYTSSWQRLEFRPDTPLSGVQFVGIGTSESPSWVAWKEIEVMGPRP